MHALGKFVHYKTKIIFRIAWYYQANIKYSHDCLLWLSVEIQWKFLTVGHLVYLRPCPAAGHIDTALFIILSLVPLNGNATSIQPNLWQNLLFQRPRKLNSFEAAACPPPTARNPRTDARLTSKRVVQGGLWHGSRAEKTTNHESRISKFHFPESRKSARKTLLSCECLKIQQNRETKKKDCK